MCFCTHSRVWPGQESSRGEEGKDWRNGDVASDGRSSSYMGSWGQQRARRTENEMEMNKTNKTDMWRLKWENLEEKKKRIAQRRRKINPGWKMCDERGENGGSEGEWGGEKGCWQSTEGLEVMDGLSRLARLSIRRVEVLKRTAEINALCRNRNYKESWKCVAVRGGKKRHSC